MAYTSADLASLDAAMLSLASGNRVAESTVNGRTTKWSPVELKELREFRDFVAGEVTDPTTTTNKRFAFVSSSKGL